MRARNVIGTSEASNTETATPNATKPAMPSGLSASRGSTTGTINLSWTAPDDGGAAITRYEYKYVKYNNGWKNWTGWFSTSSTSASFTVTGLESGELYRFRVRAVNSVGNSRSSKVAQTRAR